MAGCLAADIGDIPMCPLTNFSDGFLGGANQLDDLGESFNSEMMLDQPHDAIRLVATPCNRHIARAFGAAIRNRQIAIHASFRLAALSQPRTGLVRRG